MRQHGFHRVHRRLAEAADRGVAHHLGKLAEEILVPRRRFHDLDRLLRADAAGRALAAALILEEAQEIEGDRAHAVALGEHDDRVAADEAAIGLERAEIERDAGHAGGQDAARSAARQVALEDMALRHAAAELVDQLTHGDAGGGELDAGRFDAAGDREAAHALALVAPLGGHDGRALLDDVAHPEDGLDIVDQRRPAEEADLARERRLVARQAALALDALEHRRFLAADIGAGAAAEMDLGLLGEPRLIELGDLGEEDVAALRVFVAQIEIGVGGFDRPVADQHAFEHTVRIALEIVAALFKGGAALSSVVPPTTRPPLP